MAGSSVLDQLSLDTVLLHHEENTAEVFLGKDIAGGGSGVVGLLYNEELYVLES